MSSMTQQTASSRQIVFALVGPRSWRRAWILAMTGISAFSAASRSGIFSWPTSLGV
jgi:hypothetical protein